MAQVFRSQVGDPVWLDIQYFHSEAGHNEASPGQEQAQCRGCQDENYLRLEHSKKQQTRERNRPIKEVQATDVNIWPPQ